MKKVLMVSPEYFDVEYAINPYMTSDDGKLQKIDRKKAQDQWQKLKEIYSQLGYSVEVISGAQELPDMVFAANQSFPFWNESKNCPSVIISKMRSKFRQPETTFFEEYYSQNNYEVFRMEKFSFEGNGDALIRPGTREIYGGYGFRTDKNVYEEVHSLTRYEVFPLELQNEYFYHLDTCFSFLGKDTVAIVKEAFTQEGLSLISQKFNKIIEIDLSEAKNNFAGNCHCPDGKNVILHPGSEKFKRQLLELGFNIIETETSEYMKSGGSVFCMKMMHY